MDLFIFAFSAFLSYWYETELLLALGGILIAVRFLRHWYEPLQSTWPPEHGKAGRMVLHFLPVAAFMIILISLLMLASYDVVGIWVGFYIILGYVWLRGGVFLMESCLDLFCVNDAVHLDNKAAIFPIAGGFLGLTLIYAGANIGDGPGWWVILIAGGMGLISWIFLAWLIHLFSGISEHITVDRNMGCGIRYGAYLLASGLLLGRASSGDWTSFYTTCEEFSVGWPVIPLAFLVIVTEFFLMHNKKTDWETGLRTCPGSSIPISMLLGGCYLVYAVVFLWMYSPLGASLQAGALGVMP